MADVVDVAEYILAQRGPMSAAKLQKLCYYSQAWHLVWDGVPLFPEPIHAWANGPVIPELFAMHKGTYWVAPGMFRHYEETRDARITVIYDRGEQHYVWAVPDVVFGGLRKGSHYELTSAIEQARVCIESMYVEGLEMLRRSAQSLQAIGTWHEAWNDGPGTNT